MKSLEERLADRKKEYEEAVKEEYDRERIYNVFIPLFPQDTDIVCNIYSHIYFINISLPSLEIFEKEILVPLLGKFNFPQHEKEITDDNVIYKINFVIEGDIKSTHLRIVSRPDGKCRIIPILTGKKVMRSEWVEIEADEVAYIVDCPEPVTDLGAENE